VPCKCKQFVYDSFRGSRATTASMNYASAGAQLTLLQDGEALIAARNGRGQTQGTAEQVKMLAMVRVVKPHVGMGLEFLDIDPDSNRTLPAWIENLRKSRSRVLLTSGGVHYMTEQTEAIPQEFS
jgi:hypothetical protein